jgi:poly-gamma-glutamate synthesis protein (capsule biosynthesis protein)
MTNRRPVSSRSRKPHDTSVLIASDWAPIRAFDPIMRSQPEAIYGDLLPALRDADLRIVNLECALTKANRPVHKSGAVFKGEPAHARALACVPFEVACLANNHVLDHGVAGLRETLRVLDRHAIRHVGAGLTEREAYAPLKLRAGALQVHVVNFSEGEDLTAARGGPGVFGWDIGRAIDNVRRCKAAGGVVIAVGHCGLEYVPYPPPYVVDAFRALADAGADCVIGHHPHVPQGFEWRSGKPIIYSLGNFVFYQPNVLHYRKTGFFVTVRFSGTEVSAVDLHPYRITDTGLRRLSVLEDRDFCRDLERVSEPFRKPRGHERAWNAYLAHYGVDGFAAEVLGILERMKSEPPKGAAMFRNRVTTMQHSELWRTFLTGMMATRPPRYAARDRRTVEAWFTRVVKEDPPAGTPTR